MIKASDKFKSAMINDERQLMVRAAFHRAADGAELIFTGNDHIAELEIKETVNSEDDITMGSACSSELNMKLINAPARDDYDMMVIKTEAGVMLDDGSVEYIPMGTYYVDEVKTDNDFAELDITAYDGMCLMEKEYAANITEFPASLQTAAADVAAMAGVELSEENDFGDYQINFIPSCTLREMASYIAGMLGGYAKFDRDGKLRFAWYEDTGYRVSCENQYMNGFTKKLDRAVTVTGITSGNEELQASRGIGSSGTIISFENPFIDEKIIEDIWEQRIVRMDAASIEVTYSGQADNENSFSATAENDAWRIDSGINNLHIGDILLIEEATGWVNPPERVVVDEINEGMIALTDIHGTETISEYGAEAVFSRICQWIYEEAPAIEDEEGTLFELKAVTGWDDAPEYLRLSGINEGSKELILLDVNGQAAEAPAGAKCSLSYSKLIGYKMSFLPAELKWRGNLSVEAGDIIEAEDREGDYHRLLVMSQTITLGSGLEMSCTCEGSSENDVSFSSSMSPTSQKITRVYSDMQSTIKEVTERITGQHGGVISFGFNEAGEPEEIFIKCRDELTGKDGIWRWNAGGIGYSSNGMEGPFETAMTSDGKIAGGFIAADSIAGEAINIESFTRTYNIEANDENRIRASHVKFEASSLKEVVEASVNSIGGRNLITNSTGAIGPMEGWNVGENTVAISEGGSEYAEKLISKRAFILGDVDHGGMLSRTVSVRPDEIHTLSFKVKKDISDVRVYIDNDVCYDSDTYDGQSDEDGWDSIYYSFTPATAAVTLRIEAGIGKTLIGDIMLCAGLGSAWTQADGEVIGTNVILTEDRITIDDKSDDYSGLEISSEFTGTGMRIVETDSAKEKKTIASYTDSGTYTKTLVSEGQVSAGNIKLIPIPDIKACMFIIADN